MSVHRWPAVLLFPLLVPLLLLALAAPAPAQGQPLWVTITPGMPAGTPAEVTFDAAVSSKDQSVLEIRIHGYYRQTVVGGNGVSYTRITVPGLPSMGQAGAPELPAARAYLAVPTGLPVGFGSGVEFDVRTYLNVNVYPQPYLGDDEELDPSEDPGPGDTLGHGEVFVLPDPAIYFGQTSWPAAPAGGPYTPQTMLGSVKGALVTCHPVTWNPSTKVLRIAAHWRVTLTHFGPAQVNPAITKVKTAHASALFVNWDVAKDFWPPDLDIYHGRYLVIADALWYDELKPFMELKKSQGLEVDFAAAAAAPQDPATTRAIIAAWYADGPPGGEAYCLLVGDHARIQTDVKTIMHAGSPLDVPTDKTFGSPEDLDEHAEVAIGRLSVDDAADLAQQLERIIAYQVSPTTLGRYDRALLVSHEEDAPAKYEACVEGIVDATYGEPPAFLTVHGSHPAADDSDVAAFIDDGVGVVCYRGHGSTTAWTNWNGSESWHKNDVLGLTNTHVHPVVWAITCTNMNVPETGADCIGETWMEAVGVGAVSSFGSTITSSTHPNDTLATYLFSALYGGITTQYMTIAWAQSNMVALYPGTKNLWSYLLLGDPHMRIRTKVPGSLAAAAPSALSACDGCTQPASFTVSMDGTPVPGALVSVWKPSLLPGQPDEVLTNAYADELGQVTLDVAAATPGLLHFTAQDDAGNVATGAIPVDMGAAWDDLGGGVPGTHGALELVGIGTLAPLSPVTLVLDGALPGAPASLAVGIALLGAPFKGGTWVPDPLVLIGGVPTDGDGRIVVAATWPDGVPSGFSFYTQWWVVDPGAVLGVAGSNGLRGTTP